MLLRRIARPMLASVFIYDGFDALRSPVPHVRTARNTVTRYARTAGLKRPLTDRELKLIVRVHGGLTVAAGLGLAFGRAPRSAALLLAGLSLPLAVAQEPFTSDVTPRAVRAEKFVRSLSAVGAALLAGVDHEGRPGMGWRVAHARTERAHTKAAVAKASNA